MTKFYFLTFANTDYMKLDRILEQAKDFDMFNFIYGKTEKDIPEYIEKHKEIIKDKTGYGLWIWKPKIIMDLLNKMKYNDILVYSDAGMYINKKGKERFKYYISKLVDEKCLCVFNTNDKYKAQMFVKNDAIMSYNPEFNNEWNTYCYAGIMIIKKSYKVVRLIKDWLRLCENHDYINALPSKIHKEQPHYSGNDSDNGLFNLCLSKYEDIVYKIYPDEINLYKDDLQISHTNINQSMVDWSVLDEIPFQVRRMTPKNGY